MVKKASRYSKRSQELAVELEDKATQNLRKSIEDRRKSYWRKRKRQDIMDHVWLWLMVFGAYALYLWVWANYWR